MSQDARQKTEVSMTPEETAAIDSLLTKLADIPETVHTRGGEWSGIRVELDKRSRR